MSDSSPRVSIVIPVYRSSGSLRELASRLSATLDANQIDWQLVFVDDASPDESWKVINDIQRANPLRVIAIQLMSNFGQHNAVMCGLRNADGSYIVTMDDDLQHSPEEIPRLLKAIKASGDDVVYGVPVERKHAHWRNVGSALVSTFYRIVFRTSIQPSAFRIMRREVVDAILSYNLNYTYIDGLLAWNTRRIGQTLIDHQARHEGSSTYTFGKLLLLSMNLFTNFSLLPLQLVSMAGFLAALFGFGAGAFYLLKYFVSEVDVPGYASTIVAIFVLGGLQLLALGIMGEYLGRVHLNINRKPQYTVRQVVRDYPPQPDAIPREDGHEDSPLHAGSEIAPHVESFNPMRG